MKHPAPEQLQRYLAGETDLVQTEELTEHLARCSTCGEALALLAADDAALSGSLSLTEAEAAWIAETDLTEPVRRAIAAPRVGIQQLLLGLLIIVPGAYMLQTLTGLIADLVSARGPFALTVNLLRAGTPYLWETLEYLFNGGLLASLWPLFALGAAAWLWRRFTKEEQIHA